MIKLERVMGEFEELGAIGWDPSRGMDRLPFTENYVKARNYVQGLMENAGMATRVDSVGNLFGRFPGSDPKAKVLLTGSHLDAVPEGGLYDGPLGVLGALEAARCMKAHGHLHPVEVVAFIAEEGGEMGGTFGSRSFTGAIDLDHLPPTDTMDRLGISVEKIKNSRGDMEQYHSYIELHIEQSPFLEERKKNIGIPRAISGITRYKVSVTGEANHAGTTPSYRRRDAMRGAVSLLSQWYEYASSQTDFVSNIGVFSTHPGSPAIVPGTSEFVLELRSADHGAVEKGLRKMEELVRGLSQTKGNMTLIVDKNGSVLDETLRHKIASVCDEMNLLYDDTLSSGAMHDAGPLSMVMPGAMIFIPSVGGKSHSKAEYSHPEDIRNGVEVLARTLLALDRA